MRIYIVTLVAAALVLPAGDAAADLKVVTTHADLAAITLAIGGDRVEVVNLCEPTQDPHFVDARPDLMLELNQADLLILVGLQLEVGWLPNLITGARNPDILPGTDGYLDTSTLVERKDVPIGDIDRSEGDIHPGGNPHFTRHPESGLYIAKGISMRLALLDPDNASTYRRNYAVFEKELTEAIQGWDEKIAPFAGVPVVGYHESWIYFTDWLDLHMIGFVEPKPGIPPDPEHVAGLLERMRSHEVKIILQEEYYPDTTSQLLAEKSGATLIIVDGGVHLDDGDTYISSIDKTIDNLVTALSE